MTGTPRDRDCLRGWRRVGRWQRDWVGSAARPRDPGSVATPAGRPMTPTRLQPDVSAGRAPSTSLLRRCCRTVSDQAPWRERHPVAEHAASEAGGNGAASVTSLVAERVGLDAVMRAALAASSGLDLRATGSSSPPPTWSTPVAAPRVAAWMRAWRVVPAARTEAFDAQLLDTAGLRVRIWRHSRSRRISGVHEPISVHSFISFSKPIFPGAFRISETTPHRSAPDRSWPAAPPQRPPHTADTPPAAPAPEGTPSSCRNPTTATVTHPTACVIPAAPRPRREHRDRAASTVTAPHGRRCDGVPVPDRVRTLLHHCRTVSEFTTIRGPGSYDSTSRWLGGNRFGRWWPIHQRRHGGVLAPGFLNSSVLRSVYPVALHG